MGRILFPTVILLAQLAFAQSNCPLFSFPTVKSAALLPSPETFRILLEQSDGTYTAIEKSNFSPYETQRTIPRFDTRLSACAPTSTGLFTIVVTSVTPVPSGGYLITLVDSKNTSHLAIFDAAFDLVAESSVVPGTFFADMTGSGKLDAIGITFNHSLAAITLALHSDGATFSPPSVYPISPPSVQQFLVRDLDGDHKPDLIALTWGQILVYSGNGDGTLKPPRTVTRAGVSTRAIALNDVNGDGILDLILVDPSSTPMLNVMLGVGDGTFAAPRQIPVGPGNNIGLAVGDLNGDGIPDIFVQGKIFFGDGSGGFPSRRDIAIPETLSTIPHITDFNGDGISDVVFGLGDGSILAGDTVSVILGTGKGNFAAPPAALIADPTSGLPEPMAITAADFDSDGVPELAVALLDRTIAVFTQSEDGRYQRSLAFDFGQGVANALAVADFNRDNNLDFVVVGSGYSPGDSGRLAIVLGNGDGTFQPPHFTDATLGAFKVAVGDYNGDGTPDLALLISRQAAPAADRVEIRLGNGDGTFQFGATPYALPLNAMAIVSGDFNGDGKLDLFAISSARLSLLTGKSDGTFNDQVDIQGSTLPRIGFADAVAADWNGDGIPDVAVTFSGQQGLLVLLSNGDGTFQPAAYYAAQGASPASGDINGDGIPDLVLSGSFAMSYLLGNGDGTFKAAVSVTGPGNPLVLADLNRDGRLDVAAATGSGVASFLNTPPLRKSIHVVSTAGLSVGPLAPGTAATAFGNIPANPTVTIKDSAGYEAPAVVEDGATASQINFIIPSGLEPGTATLTIAGSERRSAQIELATIAPAVFSLNAQGLAAAYVMRVSNGTTTFEPAFAERNGAYVPVPIDVSTGQTYLVLSGTGFGAFPRATIAGNLLSASPVDTPLIPGIDQVSVALPSSLAGSGATNIILVDRSVRAYANPVYVVFK